MTTAKSTISRYVRVAWKRGGRPNADDPPAFIGLWYCLNPLVVLFALCPGVSLPSRWRTRTCGFPGPVGARLRRQSNHPNDRMRVTVPKPTGASVAKLVAAEPDEHD